MNDTARQRTIYIVGIVLAVVMIASVILPLFPQAQVAPQITPTDSPAPTLPPPVTDFTTISFEERYLHPSGLFTVAQPTGFDSVTPSNNGELVQVNMNNSETQSVIEAILDVPATPYESLDGLNARLNNEFLENSWRRYTAWTETGRRVDTENQQIVLDFELRLGQQTFLARQIARLTETGATMVRVVAPENARDYLLHLLDQTLPTVERIPAFVNSPTGFTSYLSASEGFIVRYPSTWFISDGEEGRPVTIEGDNSVLRVESRAEAAAADAAAAEAYVKSIRPNAEVTTVTEVERNGLTGWSVSYTETTLDGAGSSGLALLLNAEDGRLYAANLRIPQAAVDLNNLEEEQRQIYSVPLAILDSFTATAPLNLPIAAGEEAASTDS